ncbi:MAG TPA: AMP-binding protein [Vicinamibacterales bacterium]|nr:AMP-binding protein [Vicinamibacterales bacterium]
MPRDTLVDLFRDLGGHRGDFLVYDDGYRVRRHSYAEVTRAARAFAARLAETGVARGDKVVLWGENRPEWIVGYWGCVISGVIVVPIDYRASVEFLDKVRTIVEARITVIGDDVDAAGIAGTAPWRLSDVDWTADAPMPAVAVERNDIAQIVFTSGATAEPKGVIIRHGNIMANVVPVEREVLKYKRYARPFLPLRFLNLLPLSHMFGQSMATNIPPMVDGTVVFMRSFNPHDIVRIVKRWRISVIVCVPKILDVLEEHALRIDPSAEAELEVRLSIPRRWWRYRAIHRMFGLKFWAFVVGAAPLSAALEEFWKRLGFVVIQGYGLTETAPIVTLNHPFRTRSGSVGTPIAGVEIKIAEDGEILVRGENVTSGYYNAPAGAAARAEAMGRVVDEEGWLHTGDIGERDQEGRVFIKGRKKEMIVTAEGLNVFPDDVERVLNTQPGVRDSAVVASLSAGQERVHAVLVLEPGTTPETIVASANQSLQDHQRIRSFSVWTDGELPRTEGTRKLKRQAIREWVASGTRPDATTSEGDDPVAALIARFAGGRTIGADTSLADLGLSSLERVELMVALEDRLQTRVDETQFAAAKTMADVRALVARAPGQAEVPEPVDFPSWNRHPLVGVIRRLSLATWILPLARVFAWIRVDGREHLRAIRGPVVFAANHQSHFDVPVILAAMPGHVRKHVAPAMSKEFFRAHFFPEGQPWRQIFIKRLNYYLAAFFFNAFPLPQREAGARQTLRYIGEITADGFSILIFPEGVRSQTGEMTTFLGGIGMIGSRLEVPVVPVRVDGVHEILHVKDKMARPGRVRVSFGAPMRLKGDDYAALARQVEDAVRALA